MGKIFQEKEKIEKKKRAEADSWGTIRNEGRKGAHEKLIEGVTRGKRPCAEVRRVSLDQAQHLPVSPALLSGPLSVQMKKGPLSVLVKKTNFPGLIRMGCWPRSHMGWWVKPQVNNTSLWTNVEVFQEWSHPILRVDSVNRNMAYSFLRVHCRSCTYFSSSKW